MLVIGATAYSQTANNFNLTAYRGCVQHLYNNICTTNIAFYKDLLEILVNCGASENARLASNYCARDEEADVYCGMAESYSALLGMTLDTCGAAITIDNCSDNCRNTLKFIHSELGCCTNAFFNNTLFLFYAPVLSYFLWSSCDVDQPNSTCDDALPFTIPANPT